MRIRFLRDEIYESEGLRQGPKFHEGAIIDARADFAERWVRRGAAEAVPGGPSGDPDGELFVRLRGEDRETAEELADANAIRTPERVERRGVKYFAMAGDDKLGEGMDLAAAQAFAAANGGLTIVGLPKALAEAAAAAPPAPPAAEPGKTLPDGTPAAS